MKVRYIFDRICLERVNFRFLRTLTCLKAAFTMLSIWFVQFPSDEKVNPKCLWVFTISTGSRLNRRSKCGTALNYCWSVCMHLYRFSIILLIFTISFEQQIDEFHQILSKVENNFTLLTSGIITDRKTVTDHIIRLKVS